MNELVLVMRILHIVLGVFWAGTLFFVVLYLEPSVRGAGPAGGAVMQGIQQRRFMTIMPIVALVTILTGTFLYMRLSGQMAEGWVRTGYGMSLTIGAATSIVAFVIGLTVMRSATIAAGKLMAQINQDPDNAENKTKMARVQALRARARLGARSVALLLLVAVVSMAVARYV